MRNNHITRYNQISLYMWTKTRQPFFFFSTEHTYFQPAAHFATGTYVTSVLILLMWKKEAPLLSPDAFTTGLRKKKRGKCGKYIFQSWNNLNLLIDQQVSRWWHPGLISVTWSSYMSCCVLRDLWGSAPAFRPDWTGCWGLICVSFLQPSVPLMRLFSASYCMSKSWAADCTEHAEEAASAPLFDASVYSWGHEPPQRSVV